MIVRNIVDAENIDSRTVLCKAIMAAKTYFGDRFFTRRRLMYILIKTVKLKKPTSYTKKYNAPESISKEQALRMFNIMLEQGYIEYSHNFKPGPGIFADIPPGEKMYQIGQLRYAECTETSWFKNRQRKERYLKKESGIDKRSCKALQQIYVMFGNMPFSYNTVTETSRMVLELSSKKGITKSSGEKVEFTPAEKAALEHMKSKLYGYDKDAFRQVWQSLIRNGYVLQHRVKTPEGYIKKTGLYKINQAYLKYCLAELL